MKLLTAFVLLGSLAGTASIPPAMAQSMQDQKLCADQAEKVVEDMNDRARSLKENQNSWVESHVNNQLHICMALITTNVRHGDYPEVWKSLQDAFGGHQFAQYQWVNKDHQHYWDVKPWNCSFEKTPYGATSACNTTEEFDAAVQPYMTN
jgi:hypothetical protein